MATLPLGHITLDDRGVAWIYGANTKVIEVALDMIAHGSSPDEIHEQHPHLTLAQIHAALSYYYDHKQEMDAQIAADYAEYERLRALAMDSPLREKLRKLGLLS